MDIEGYVRFVLALLFVFGLIGLLALLLRRFGGGVFIPFAAGRGGNRRIEVVETAPIDPRHRLVLVRRDDREHLLLIGPAGPMVVEARITAAKPSPSEVRLPDDIEKAPTS